MNSVKIFFLFLGDVIALYAALFITLILRYGNGWYFQLVERHFTPFTIVFIPWLLVFYIAGLYDLRRLRNNLDFLKTLALSLVTNAVIAVIVFYLVPAFGIAPKTNLIVFIVLFAAVEVFWRRAWNRATASGEAPNRAVLVGDGAAAAEAELTVAENPQLGYAVVAHIKDEETARSPRALADLVRENGANVVVVPRKLKHQSELAPALYQLFGQGVVVMDLDRFYESVTRKVPLAEVEETWFIDNIEGVGRYYDPLKRALEFGLALVFGTILLPLELLIALLVKLSSPGPVIYEQIRVGKNGKPFTLYKFRTMRKTDKNGWLDTDKARITGIGRVLRSTHLDELPQFINLLRGDVSLVGPRPDFIEFYDKLKDVIPYYSIRTIVKPGVTGWAQIAFPITESLEQTKERLCYDVYYLKNRSLIFDILIILRTLKTVVTASGK